MKTLSGNRLSQKFLRECFAHLSYEDLVLEVGKDLHGDWVGIPNSQNWLESFKEVFAKSSYFQPEIIDGIRPHLKGIKVFIPSFLNEENWPELEGKLWVSNGVSPEPIKSWEVEIWKAKNHGSVEERWQAFLNERQHNPKNTEGKPLLNNHDQNERTLELQQTEDGSYTLFFKELNETYHSTQGAHVEALWVFVERGFEFVFKQKADSNSASKVIRILEVGFGTGLNAFLTGNQFLFGNLKRGNFKIEYLGLEPFPLDYKWVKALGYTQFWEAQLNDFYKEIHLKAEAQICLGSDFELKKTQQSLESFESKNTFDLIYYDAFAPNKQSEIWSEQNMQKCHDVLSPGGVLVSYCAKGEFKRNLKKVGFKVESLPGPPGRREMVRAIKV